MKVVELINFLKELIPWTLFNTQKGSWFCVGREKIRGVENCISVSGTLVSENYTVEGIIDILSRVNVTKYLQETMFLRYYSYNTIREIKIIRPLIKEDGSVYLLTKSLDNDS